MPEINISVRNKIAQPVGQPQIICGNSDYTVAFDLDEEWAGYSVKTMRCAYWLNGLHVHEDVFFTGTRAAIPALYDIGEVEIGLCAGDVISSTLARIPCVSCIMDGAPSHDDPSTDVYDQLLAYLAQMQSSTAEGNAVTERRGVMESTVGTAQTLEEET